MSNYLALTVMADDRPGIIERVSELIAAEGGNWLESSMSRLAGKFAGILLVEITPERQADLMTKLSHLAEQGIKVYGEASSDNAPRAEHRLQLSVMGNDRPGIVSEIASLLARLSVNLEELSTSCESAPMSAETLFRASATIQLPEALTTDALQTALEELSADLVVELDRG